MFFHILGSIAEIAHALMAERTYAGLAGSHTLTPGKLVRQAYEETGQDGKRANTAAQIAAEFTVSRPPFIAISAPRKFEIVSEKELTR